MGSSKWKKITEAISQQGFSIQRLEVPIFEVTPGVIDFKNEIGIVKVLDNETLGELLSIANHSFSHGNEQGLYETWSKEQREKGEDPTGYLSEQEVIAQIQKLKSRKGQEKMKESANFCEHQLEIKLVRILNGQIVDILLENFDEDDLEFFCKVNGFDFERFLERYRFSKTEMRTREVTYSSLVACQASYVEQRSFYVFEKPGE